MDTAAFPSSANQEHPFKVLDQPAYILATLVGFHIFVLALSNYLVQIPFTIAGFQNTWGTVSFSLVYLATDLTVRIYGPSLVRRIIGFTMLPALIISYCVSVLFLEGHYQGVAALTSFSIIVARIAFASFAAYFVGQLLDVTVFNRLRRLRQWWVAPTASTIIGNALDTAVFYWIAFYKSSDVFMATHWVEIGILDYAFKVTICLLLALPLYGVLLSSLQKKLLQK